MKILLLSKSTTAHTFGGIETHAEAVGRSAKQLGHDVVAITTAHPRGVAEETRDGVSVEYLEGTPPGVYSGIWWEKSAEAVQRWRSRGFGDLILSFSLAGYGVAAANVPIRHYAFAYGEVLKQLISEWHDWAGFRGLAAYPKHVLATVYFACLERRLWSRLDGVIATYDALHQKLRRLGYPAYLSYNGTEVGQFAPDEHLRQTTRRALGIGPDAPVLLMVATVNRQKGIWVGVEAFRRLTSDWPALHLVIVGDGSDRPRLEATLVGTPLVRRVHWVGAVAPQATAAYFAAADLLLYPTFRMEGLPIAIVEAMSTGLPVVASDRGGIRSAVEHGETGLLLPSPAVGPLVSALSALLSDPDLRISMGKLGRERVLERFDTRILLPRLLHEISPEARR